MSTLLHFFHPFWFEHWQSYWILLIYQTYSLKVCHLDCLKSYHNAVHIGLPLALFNVFGLHLTQGQPITWQSPLFVLMDALQRGIVEEVIYRFVLWGLWTQDPARFVAGF